MLRCHNQHYHAINIIVYNDTFTVSVIDNICCCYCYSDNKLLIAYSQESLEQWNILTRATLYVPLQRMIDTRGKHKPLS